MRHLILPLILACFVTFSSCKKEETQRRRGIDYNEIKPELVLSEEQEKKFDAIIAKYTKIAEESRAAASADGAKIDRTTMFIRMEERTKQQTEEIAEILDDTQLGKYKEFVDKNTRKRPRYNNETLQKIKTELQLDDQQSVVLEAANNAFEKAFQDAHDFYHGNGELAREYWEKYDAERKNALKNVFTEEQYSKFEEIVKDLGYGGRR